LEADAGAATGGSGRAAEAVDGVAMPPGVETSSAFRCTRSSSDIYVPACLSVGISFVSVSSV
jgi:hypothetical protein